MKYGLIGEKLGHSYSKIIHGMIADYEYELCEIAKENINAFLTAKDFRAINVTIPYKKTVIPYLDEIDPEAEMIGAVNTVINRNGRLTGYNTDIYGLGLLAEHAGVELSGKKVAILGTGGTSQTAAVCAEQKGAEKIIRVSRKAGEGVVTYDELYALHSDTEVIINTTPVGMYPSCGEAAVDISRLPNLVGVLDAIYNPLRTKLVVDALERGIPAEGGLYMLVAQAVRAAELFLDKTYPADTVDKVYRRIYRETENIVLIGMPSSGKTSVGKALAEQLGRDFLDTDAVIVENEGMEIPKIFEKRGEGGFRDAESEAVKACAKGRSLVLATGGGAVLREENVRTLRENGRIYFIDRPLEALIPTGDRPLSSNREALRKRYNERYPIYTSCADVHVDGSGSVCEVAERIIEDFCK